MKVLSTCHGSIVHLIWPVGEFVQNHFLSMILWLGLVPVSLFVLKLASSREMCDSRIDERIVSKTFKKSEGAAKEGYE